MTLPLKDDAVDILLDDDNDIVFETDDVAWSRGPKAVGQRLRIKLGIFRGEWFANLDVGMPYVARDDGSVTEDEAILGGKFDETRIRSEFTTQIVEDPDVAELISLNIDFDTRTRELAVAWEVRTVFGDTIKDSLAPGGTA